MSRTDTQTKAILGQGRKIIMEYEPRLIKAGQISKRILTEEGQNDHKQRVGWHGLYIGPRHTHGKFTDTGRQKLDKLLAGGKRNVAGNRQARAEQGCQQIDRSSHPGTDRQEQDRLSADRKEAATRGHRQTGAGQVASRETESDDRAQSRQIGRRIWADTERLKNDR